MPIAVVRASDETFPLQLPKKEEKRKNSARLEYDELARS